MTLNQKAALQTFAIVLAMVAGSVGTTFVLNFLGPQAPAIAGCTLLFGMFVYLTFTIVKNRLEYNQKLDEITKK